eukprot:UN09465
MNINMNNPTTTTTTHENELQLLTQYMQHYQQNTAKLLQMHQHLNTVCGYKLPSPMKILEHQAKHIGMPTPENLITTPYNNE